MPLKPCIECGALSDQSRCPTHRRPAWRQSNERTRTERGYDNAWLRLSAAVIRDHPTCQACGNEPSTSADHIKPLAEGGARLDRRNVQALGDRCKRRKDAADAQRGSQRARGRLDPARHARRTIARDYSKRRLVLIIGAPGAGKTRHAQQTYQHVVSLDATDIGSAFDILADHLAANHTVAFDTVGANQTVRKRAHGLAHAFHATTMVTYIYTPLQTCITRRPNIHPIKLRRLHAQLEHTARAHHSDLLDWDTVTERIHDEHGTLTAVRSLHDRHTQRSNHRDHPHQVGESKSHRSFPGTADSGHGGALASGASEPEGR